MLDLLKMLPIVYPRLKYSWHKTYQGNSVSQIYTALKIQKKSQVSEWVIKFNGLSWTADS